jgi:hypothetical protein
MLLIMVGAILSPLGPLVRDQKLDAYTFHDVISDAVLDWFGVLIVAMT